jgi:hypothetical protein
MFSLSHCGMHAVRPRTQIGLPCHDVIARDDRVNDSRCRIDLVSVAGAARATAFGFVERRDVIECVASVTLDPMASAWWRSRSDVGDRR